MFRQRSWDGSGVFELTVFKIYERNVPCCIPIDLKGFKMRKMTSEKFGEWIEEGFALYKANFGVLVLSGLVAGLVSVFSMGILTGPMLVGWIMMILRLQDGETVAVGDIFQGFTKFLDSFLYMLVVSVGILLLILILGIVPCVGSILAVAAVYAVIALVAFAPFRIAESDVGFWKAIQESYEAVKPNFWLILGLVVVAGILGSLGAIACGVGVIFTAPINYCILAVVYHDLLNGGAVLDVEPSEEASTEEAVWEDGVEPKSE